MDATRFDHLTRTLTVARSRRTVLSLGAAALGLVAAQLPGVAGAKKKRKTKNSKLNEYGCLNVGQACNGNDGKCCSGICQGKKLKKDKKDTSRCVGHDAFDCQAGQDQCAGVPVSCGASPLQHCYRTTGNASFCSGSGGCAACQTDADCVAGGSHGESAACVVCAECTATGGTACFRAAS